MDDSMNENENCYRKTISLYFVYININIIQLQTKNERLLFTKDKRKGKKKMHKQKMVVNCAVC